MFHCSSRLTQFALSCLLIRRLNLVWRENTYRAVLGASLMVRCYNVKQLTRVDEA